MTDYYGNDKPDDFVAFQMCPQSYQSHMTSDGQEFSFRVRGYAMTRSERAYPLVDTGFGDLVPVIPDATKPPTTKEKRECQVKQL